MTVRGNYILAACERHVHALIFDILFPSVCCSHFPSVGRAFLSLQQCLCLYPTVFPKIISRSCWNSWWKLMELLQIDSAVTTNNIWIKTLSCVICISQSDFLVLFSFFISLVYGTRFQTEVNKCDFPKVNGCKWAYTIQKSNIRSSGKESVTYWTQTTAFEVCKRPLRFILCFIFLHISSSLLSSHLLSWSCQSDNSYLNYVASCSVTLDRLIRYWNTIFHIVHSNFILNKKLIWGWLIWEKRSKWHPPSVRLAIPSLSWAQ